MGATDAEKPVTSSIHEADFPESPLRRLWGFGLSVIPVAHRTRHPLVAWSGFQTRLPTEAEITEWEARFPGSGVGIICGQVSRLAVLDVDPRNGGDASMKAYPALPQTVATGGGGTHTYFRVDEPLPTIHNLLPGVDLQAEGGLIFAPPTVHASGERYRWVGTCVSGMPEWITDLVAKSGATVPVARGIHILALPPNSGLQAPDFLGVLAGVRKVRGGYVACCPAHDDSEPSLGIRVLPDGKPWVKCFSGCNYLAVMQSIQWRMQARG